MTKRHKQRQRQQRSTWAMSKNEFNKGDRVYVPEDYTSPNCKKYDESVK